MKTDFYNSLSKKNTVPKYYSRLYFVSDNTVFNETSILNTPNKNNAINVALFPTYLKAEFQSCYKHISIEQLKIIGYSVLIKKYTCVTDLLSSEYKKSFKANILRFVNRFEHCFNASYKMYHGTIDKDNYNYLMHELHAMLTNRFNQRNDTNAMLNNWQYYLDNTYTQILEKKASLFVIYQNTEPVHICINHHFNKVLFVSIPSYNIDYAKFALGNISLYKLLEWAVNNQYKLMDMAYGYLEYKRRWSNNTYGFKHHILHPKKSPIARIQANLEVYKLTFKNYLKAKGVDEKIEKIKKTFFKRKTRFTEQKYNLETYKEIIPPTAATITKQDPLYKSIKKPINDFLFKNKEHANKLSIYKTTNKNEYLLFGENTQQKLILLNKEST